MSIFKLPSITTAQRAGLVLGERELVFDTDTNEVYRGDGVTAGGLAFAGGSAAWGGITGTLSAQGDLATALNGKQATLVSATNIKTLNGSTILGSGDLAIVGVTNLTYTAATRILASDTGTDATLPLFTSTDAGLVPASGGGTANFLRADGGWAAPGGGGATNLTYTAATGVVASDTGTDATITLADGTNRGLMSSADFTKLGAISGTNTGDQTTIAGITGTKAQFNTAVTDGDILYVGDVTSNATHTGDVTGATALTIAVDVVTNAKLADMAANTVKVRAAGTSGDPSDLALAASQLLGRGATGDVAAITLGTNLSFTGATLNASGGGGVSDGDKGDITVTATGATWTIDPGVVTLAKQADVATSTVFYRKTAATGSPEVQTLATLKTDLGLTGTNSGDQTTIAGITGTKAQFNTAVTDGDIQFVGDAPTAHTHLLAAGATDVTVTAANLNALDDGLNTALHFHDADRARANHTGTQLAATISDFATAVAATASVTANTAKVTNATHTGDVTGATALTIAADVVDNTKLANMATQTFKGRTTAATGDPEDLTVAQAKTMLNLTGTNSGDQTITLTGDVTGSGTGSFAATVAADVITNAKLANVATATIKGRVTAATGDPEDLTGTQATTLLDPFTSALKGLAPASGGGTANFLRADGTWAAPGGGGATNLTYTAATRVIASDTGTDATLPLMSSGDAGLVPASGGGTTNFLRADGTFAAPGGGGSPGGSTLQVQYNSAGAFAGASKVSIGTDGNLVLASNAAAPTVPPADTVQLYARRRAGADWLEVQRPNGRDVPLGPHMGLNRVAWWVPSTGTAVTANGIPRTGVGTVSHLALASTNLLTSMRRWRVTSATTANSVCDERSAVTCCWRGNAAGLGGFTYTNRIGLPIIQAASRAFYGLWSSTGAATTTQDPAALTNCVVFGFVNGVDTQWQLYHNDAAGGATKVALGVNFPLPSASDVYTIIIYAPPNGASIFARMLNETTGDVFEHEVTTDLPPSTTFLSVRNYLNNGGAAAAVAHECAGIYLETDY